MVLSSNQDLLDHLIASAALKTPVIIEAFKKVDRADFVPAELRPEAYQDQPLPIGEEQTISQPSTVAFMLELLQPKVAGNFLEIGAGSGYVAALLSQIAGNSGHVIAIEKLPKLAEQAKQNLKIYGFEKLELIAGDGSKGYQEQSPYDGIIVSAAARQVPEALLKQLKDGGRLVAPVGVGSQDVILWEKSGQSFKQKKYPGFIFVPLVSDN